MGQVSASSLITASKQNLIDEVRSLLSFGIDVEHFNEQVLGLILKQTISRLTSTSSAITHSTSLVSRAIIS
jgi:hypothetical protein